MKKIILLILDGFGVYPDYKGNAIKKANTPVLDRLMMLFCEQDSIRDVILFPTMKEKKINQKESK